MMDQVVGYLIAGLVPVLLGALAVGLRIGVRLMSESQNAVVRSIGELAYHEIEKNFAGASGEEKLARALAAARKRIGDNKTLKNVSDADLIKAIEAGWHQNEGQYKVTDSSDAQP